MSVSKRDNLLRLQTLYFFFKTKLAILPFLCSGEVVKKSNGGLLSLEGGAWEENAGILHTAEYLYAFNSFECDYHTISKTNCFHCRNYA